MAGCAEQVFEGVTSEHFRQFAAKAQGMGMPDLAGAGHRGEATESGVTIRWAFEPQASVLRVQCMDAPFLLPCGLINGKIKEAITAVLGSGGAAQEQA